MKKEEKVSILSNIAAIKKNIMMLRIKASSGEVDLLKGLKKMKKEVARQFTKLNQNN